MNAVLFVALLLAIIWSYPASASIGGGTLTLVSDASYNKLQVTLAIPSVGASNTQTTTVNRLKPCSLRTATSHHPPSSG